MLEMVPIGTLPKNRDRLGHTGCDWLDYNKSKAARDAILYQLDDVKLKKKDFSREHTFGASD